MATAIPTMAFPTNTATGSQKKSLVVEPSPGVVLAWTFAGDEICACGGKLIEPPHILLGVLRVAMLGVKDLEELMPFDVLRRDQVASEASVVHRRFGLLSIDLSGVHDRLRSFVTVPEEPDGPVTFIHRSQASRDIFKRADSVARSRGTSGAEVRDLLFAVLEARDPMVIATFKAKGCDEPVRAVFGFEPT